MCEVLCFVLSEDMCVFRALPRSGDCVVLCWHLCGNLKFAKIVSVRVS